MSDNTIELRLELMRLYLKDYTFRGNKRFIEQIATSYVGFGVVSNQYTIFNTIDSKYQMYLATPTRTRDEDTKYSYGSILLEDHTPLTTYQNEDKSFLRWLDVCGRASVVEKYSELIDLLGNEYGIARETLDRVGSWGMSDNGIIVCTNYGITQDVYKALIAREVSPSLRFIHKEKVVSS